MKNHYYHYVLLNIFSYAAIGAILPLIGQHLKSIDITGTQIGIITAMATATAIFATTFWGKRYANSHRKKTVAAFLCIMAGAVAFSLLPLKAFFIFLVGFMTLYFFQSPIMGIIDAMTIESGNFFNDIRKWGAIGFAVSTFIAGKLAYGIDLKIIFPLCTFFFIFTALIIKSIDIKEKDLEIATPAEKREKAEYRNIFKNRTLLAVVLSAFFVLGTNVANNTYFSFLYIEGGGNLSGVGTAFLLMAGSEAIFMGVSRKISGKITMEKNILIAMILSALRFLWYSTGPTSSWLLAFFFLQGMVNGIILVEFIRYVHKTVNTHELAMGIAVYYAVSNNLSTIACQLLGGLALDLGGGRLVYLFFSLYNLIGVILYMVFGLHKGKKSL